jgi:hypothetical protein
MADALRPGLIALAKLRNQKAAYWGIDTRYPAANKLPCDPAKTNGLQNIRTRLNVFDRTEQESLSAGAMRFAMRPCDPSSIRRRRPRVAVSGASVGIARTSDSVRTVNGE